MKTLPQIVSPPYWYMGFWVLVFLPCFGVTVFLSVKLAVLAAYKVLEPQVQATVKSAVMAALKEAGW